MKKTHLSISVFFTVILLISCSKDEKSSNDSAEKNLLAKLKSNEIVASKNSSESKTTTDFSNNNNPYEYVGVSHNNSLDYIATFMSNIVDNNQSLSVEIIDPANGKTIIKKCYWTVDKITALSIKYANENVKNQGSANLTIDSEFKSVNNAISYLESNKFTDPRTKGLAEFNFDYSKKLLHLENIGQITEVEVEIDGIIMSQVASTDNLDNSIKIIKTAESDILNSYLNETIKRRQLSHLSILRNSLGYWSKVTVDPKNPWWQLNERLFNKSGVYDGFGKFHWHEFWTNIIIATADGIGGLIGGAAGGAIGGPVGADFGVIIVGAAASGVAGGLLGP